MEAPPHRPGHVGHTPQPVEQILRGSRIAGILSSVLVREAAENQHGYAMQAFPRLGYDPARVRTVATVLEIQRASETLSPRRWPYAFLAGFSGGPGPLAPR